MKKHYLFLSLLGILFVQIGWTQQKTVTGNITDADGLPLPGATIAVENTTNGVTTNFDGDFSITAANGDTLIISYVGYTNARITVGSANSYNISLQPDNLLEEVVVTSLGIKRDTKALGYAVQNVDSETIANSNATDAISALTGQAAGVQVISTSGSAGAGSRIVIRGQTSLSGNNQALIVVDGVRIDNSQFASESRNAGVAGSNRGMDINPDDIESINVLKGGSAAALYGVDGGNGVIVITTKKGKAGEMKVSLRTNVAFSQANKFPKLQTTYAQGTGGEWRGPDTGWFGSWGPNAENLYWDGSDYEYDKNGRIVIGNTGGGNLKKYTPYNVFDFFKTGVTLERAFSISGGNDTTSFRLSYSKLDEEGIVPKNSFDRNTLSFSGSTQLADKFKVDLTGTYTNSKSYRIQQGSNISGLMLGLLRTPPSFDNANGFSNAENEVSAYEFEDGSQRNYRGGGGYDNPYWIVNNAPYTDNVNRFVGSVAFNYELNKWLNLSANIGVDSYSDDRLQFFDIGSRTNKAGAIILDNYNYLHTDNYFNLNGDTKINDKIDLGYLLGVNVYSQKRTKTFVQGDQLGIKGFNNITNASQVQSDYDIFKRKNIGFYGQIDLAYDNMLYLTLTGRQDYLSTLEDPTKFNLKDIDLFYPSASLGFVFSELIENNEFLSFGKLRASWAQVGAGAPTTYATSTAYEVADIGDGWTNGITFPFDGSAGFQINDDLGNNSLVPSTVTNKEFGLDLRLLNNKINFDFAYYHRLANKQILAVPIANSTGYNSSFLNSGELETTGYEVVMNAKIVNHENFKYNLRINFDKSETIVNTLSEGVESQYLGGFVIYNIPGERFGQIYGGTFKRDDAGNIIIDDDPNSSNYGYQIADPELKVIGDPTPDFTIGFNNSFSYKNLSLDFLFEWKKGGQMWNGVDWALTWVGTAKQTEDRDTQRIIKGVKNSDGSPNDIVADINEYYYRSSGLNGFGNVDEHFVQDASWLRLRTLNLRYNLTEVIKNDFFDNISINFTGNNLWLQTPYTGVDPETSLTGAGSNAQGVDYFNNPGTKSYGVGINLTF